MDELKDILRVEDLRRLRRDKPEALFQHLTDMQQSFLFGVEDHRDEEQRWGGEVRVLINRNLALHFVPAFNEEMTQAAELPQFTVMPDEERVDRHEETRLELDDGDTLRGVIFYVDPLDYDAYVREALEVVEAYPEWDAVPDSYYLHTDLVRFLTRVVLDHEVIVAEREFDFRLGLVGGVAPPPLEGQEALSAEELIARGAAAYSEEEASYAEVTDRADGDEEDDDDGEERMRSHPVQWG